MSNDTQWRTLREAYGQWVRPVPRWARPVGAEIRLMLRGP